MSPAITIISLLLAAALAFSAIRKLSHEPRYVEGYLRVGVPEDRLDPLAVVLVAGAAGLIAGLFWTPVGIAAAAGLVVYFLVAIGFHLRAGDAESLPTPLVMEALAVSVLGLQLATL